MVRSTRIQFPCYRRKPGAFWKVAPGFTATCYPGQPVSYLPATAADSAGSAGVLGPAYFLAYFFACVCRAKTLRGFSRNASANGWLAPLPSPFLRNAMASQTNVSSDCGCRSGGLAETLNGLVNIPAQDRRSVEILPPQAVIHAGIIRIQCGRARVLGLELRTIVRAADHGAANVILRP